MIALPAKTACSNHARMTRGQQYMALHNQCPFRTKGSPQMKLSHSLKPPLIKWLLDPQIHRSSQLQPWDLIDRASGQPSQVDDPSKPKTQTTSMYRNSIGFCKLAHVVGNCTFSSAAPRHVPKHTDFPMYYPVIY
eukprot:scaffold450342_cov17-Prasinocladus_malaysianus.AAC.1